MRIQKDSQAKFYVQDTTYSVKYDAWLFEQNSSAVDIVLKIRFKKEKSAGSSTDCIKISFLYTNK